MVIQSLITNSIKLTGLYFSLSSSLLKNNKDKLMLQFQLTKLLISNLKNLKNVIEAIENDRSEKIIHESYRQRTLIKILKDQI